MAKKKTVQVSFEASVTAEIDADEWKLLQDTESLEEFAEEFEGIEVVGPYGRAWLASVDADKAAVL